MLTEDDIRNALKGVKYPGYTRDVISFGLVKQIAVKDGAVSVIMNLTSANPEAARQIKGDSEKALRVLPAVKAVYVEVNQPSGSPASAAGQQNPRARQARVPGLRPIVALPRGDGGGRKSPLSVQLARAPPQLG